MLDKSLNVKVEYLVAAAIGVLYGWFQRKFWAIYAVDNSVNNWLVQNFGTNDVVGWYYLFSSIHDFVIHLLLGLALALVLVRVFGARNWRPILVVVLASQIPMFWDAVWENMGTVIRFWKFWTGLAIALAAIPVAYFIMGTVLPRKEAK